MRAFVVDAFTDVPFRGNPAGVVLLADRDANDDAWLQQVASEFRHCAAVSGAGVELDFPAQSAVTRPAPAGLAAALGVDRSAHCTLGPLWAARLDRTSLVGVQLSPRGGRVGVDIRGDRVTLRGRAVTVLRGDLLPG